MAPSPGLAEKGWCRIGIFQPLASAVRPRRQFVWGSRSPAPCQCQAAQPLPSKFSVRVTRMTPTSLRRAPPLRTAGLPAAAAAAAAWIAKRVFNSLSKTRGGFLSCHRSFFSGTGTGPYQPLTGDMAACSGDGRELGSGSVRPSCSPA
jgi:hypothetical protein